MSNNRGQTLVEALLATAVAITVIVALVGVGINSMRVANYSKNQAEAVKLAREQLELLRNLRDSSWSNFTGSAGVGSQSTPRCNGGNLCCFSFVDGSVVSFSSGTFDTINCLYNNTFKVSFTADTSIADKVTTTVTSSFTEGSLTRNVTLVETFTNWRGN